MQWIETREKNPVTPLTFFIVYWSFVQPKQLHESEYAVQCALLEREIVIVFKPKLSCFRNHQKSTG